MPFEGNENRLQTLPRGPRLRTTGLDQPQNFQLERPRRSSRPRSYHGGGVHRVPSRGTLQGHWAQVCGSTDTSSHGPWPGWHFWRSLFSKKWLKMKSIINIQNHDLINKILLIMLLYRYLFFQSPGDSGPTGTSGFPCCWERSDEANRQNVKIVYIYSMRFVYVQKIILYHKIVPPG